MLLDMREHGIHYIIYITTLEKRGWIAVEHLVYPDVWIVGPGSSTESI